MAIILLVLHVVQDRASEARAIISDSTLDVLKAYDLFYSLRLCDFINYETRDCLVTDKASKLTHLNTFHFAC
jgi:hypothetical protein